MPTSLVSTYTLPWQTDIVGCQAGKQLALAIMMLYYTEDGVSPPYGGYLTAERYSSRYL